MNRIKWHYKLFLLAILIAVIPALIISLNMISITETQLTSNVNDELINASRLLTHEIDLFFDEFTDKQRLMKSSIENDKLGSNEKVAILVSAVEDIEELIATKLLFQNSHGGFDEAITVIKEDYENNEQNKSVLENIYVGTEELASDKNLDREAMIGDAVYAEPLDTWFVLMLSKVNIAGAPDAVLFSIIDISEIENRLIENPILGVGNMYIINSGRNFIFNNPFDDGTENIVLNDAAEMLNKTSRIMAVNNYKRNGRVIITSVAFPKSIDWAVISEMEKDAAYALVNQMNNVFAVWILIGVGIAFVGVLLFTKSISKPINYLAGKAKIISGGDFEISTNYKANDSIGLLGNTLVSMSKSLKKSFERIESQNKQLEEYNRNLEDKVKERTLQLKNTNEQLQEAYLNVLELNRDKNEFLGIAAHDLKNPLAAIKGFGSMIIDEEEMPRHDIVDFANNIVESSERMFSIITNLLDVNKIEEGKIDVNYERVNIVKMINEIISLNKENARRKNIELVLHISSPVEEIETDKNLVSQIIDNLLSNAIKFSSREKSVIVDVAYKENKLQISVKDEGPGLSNDDKKSLFKKFAKLSARPTGGEHSTGLGLSIVKKISEVIGADIIVESEHGKGAEFTLILPNE